MKRFSALLILLALLLVACEGKIVYVTVTPGGDPAVPTQENIACNSDRGLVLSPHCGPGTYLQPVNPNSDLTQAGVGNTLFPTVTSGAEVIQRTVQVPNPASLYEWAISTNGLHGTKTIAGLSPNIFFKQGSGFEANISSLNGNVMLRLKYQLIYVRPGRYVVGFEGRSKFKTLDPAQNNNPTLLNRYCEFRTLSRPDAIPGALQNGGPTGWKGWTDPAANIGAVYVLKFESDVELILTCGISIPQPVFDGDYVFTRFFVSPVAEDYGVGSEIVIR